MWKAVSKICYLILWIFSLGIGIGLYVIDIYPSFKEYLFNYISKAELAIGTSSLRVLATILILIPLVALFAKMRSKKKIEPLVYHTAEGPVVIETTTLNNFVKSVIKAYEPVNHASVTTEEDHKKVNVIARVYLNDNQPVASVVAELQLAIRSSVREAFGLDLLRDIRIEVARLTAGRRRLQKLLGNNSDGNSKLSDGQGDNMQDDIETADYKSVSTTEKF
ncbi:alkaline shock response membrane anchor protein AmaP [bacterium]|nr:alkaline shock response membrane anchor protein AmaP [bacterium]